MKYRTTLGSYAVILGLGPAAIAGTTVTFWLHGWWLMVGLTVVPLCLFGWVVLGTRYAVEQDALDIRLGPLHKRIALGDITGVHRHRMLEGPMFGLGSDFISIEYGERAVNISPKDADDFVNAISKATERPSSPRAVPAVE